MTNYKKTIQQIVARRKNDLVLNEQKLIEAMRQNEELYKTDLEIRTLQQQKRRGQEIDESFLYGLKLKRSKMFLQLGLSEVPPFRCQKCQDTGIIDGKPCACVVAATINSETTTANFEDSDLSVFDPNDRDSVQKAYATMQAFCSKFPNTNSKNIILSGSTGTGKTFLASCVAGRLTDNGYSVMFVTAFGFVNRMLGYHTAPMDEKLDYLSPVIDCDLLVIDDLGTESRLKNVTVEYLYSILNERMRLNKHTMITTNFDKDMLAQRYGERVFSRLFDKRISASIILAAKDIRKK